MKKIVFIDETAEIGGAEINLLLLAEQLNQLNWDIEVWLPKLGPLVQKLEARSIPVKIIPAFRWFSVSFYLFGKKIINPAALIVNLISGLIWSYRLRTALKETRPQVVQTVSLWGHAWGGFAARSFNIPHVAHFQDIVSKGLFQFLVNQWGNSIPTKIICISKPVAKQFNLNASKKLITLPNIVDINKFTPATNKPKNNILTIGTVARITRWKGQDQALKVAALLKQENIPFQWWFIGSAALGSEDFFEELKDFINKHQLTEVVTLAGWHENMPAFYQSLDLLVHLPTETEPFGLVLAEGLASGLSVIATEGGGADELVRAGGGFLVSKTNPVIEARNRVVDLWQNPSLLSQSKQEARRIAENLFSLSVYIFNWQTIYKELGA